MGNALKSGVRMVQRFNVENRAHRLIESDKLRSAPRHPTTAKEIQELQEKNPDVLHEQQRKDEKLARFLEKIRVDSTDPDLQSPPDTPQQNLPAARSRRSLPVNRQPKPEPTALFEVPDEVPEGRLTVPMAIEMLAKHKRNPEEWPVERLADEYKLDLSDAQHVLEYFHSFKVIPVEKSTTPEPKYLFGR